MSKLFKIEARRKRDSVVEVEYVGGTSQGSVFSRWSKYKDISMYSTVDIYLLDSTYERFIEEIKIYGSD
jgi:hypothetical protein